MATLDTRMPVVGDQAIITGTRDETLAHLVGCYATYNGRQPRHVVISWRGEIWRMSVDEIDGWLAANQPGWKENRSLDDGSVWLYATREQVVLETGERIWGDDADWILAPHVGQDDWPISVGD